MSRVNPGLLKILPMSLLMGHRFGLHLSFQNIFDPRQAAGHPRVDPWEVRQATALAPRSHPLHWVATVALLAHQGTSRRVSGRCFWMFNSRCLEVSENLDVWNWWNYTWRVVHFSMSNGYGEMMIHHITIEFGWTCGRILFQKMSESLGWQRSLLQVFSILDQSEGSEGMQKPDNLKCGNLWSFRLGVASTVTLTWVRDATFGTAGSTHHGGSDGIFGGGVILFAALSIDKLHRSLRTVVIANGKCLANSKPTCKFKILAHIGTI